MAINTVKRILYLGPGEASEFVRKILEPQWQVSASPVTAAEIASYLSDTVAILDASMKVTFDRTLLEKASQLRVISTATTGADHIDAGTLADRHIALLTLGTEKEVLQNLTPAAELSWALLMACARHLRGAVDHVIQGKWVREDFPGIMLKGKTLGLVGCGRIGSWMARYGRAFDMNVIGYDPLVDPWPEQIQKVDLPSLLSAADFVSIHVPYNRETRRLIGLREFNSMKHGAVLINTSRGGLVDETALLSMLQSGHIGAAGLDVLDGEPSTTHHPLVQYARQHDNLIITPHIGGFSPDAVKVAVAHAARRIRDFLTKPECRCR